MRDLIDLLEAEYHGEHIAPDREGGAPLYDLTANEMYPTDVYGPHGRLYYAEDTPQAFAVCMQYRGRPNRMITVYRAIPRDAKPARINPGDWVSLTRAYAKEHGVSALNGEAKIVSKTVAVRDLYTEGNSLEEWGYDPQPNVNRAAEDAIRARLGMETKTEALARGAARRSSVSESIINEAQMITVKKGLREIKMWRNPTRSDLTSLAERFSLRGLSDGENFFVWRAYDCTHYGAMEALYSEKLANFSSREDNGRITVNPSCPEVIDFYVAMPNGEIAGEWRTYGTRMSRAGSADIWLNGVTRGRISNSPRLSRLLASYVENPYDQDDDD